MEFGCGNDVMGTHYAGESTVVAIIESDEQILLQNQEVQAEEV